MDLLQLGFQEVGQWQLDGNLKSGVCFSLNAFHNDRVVYGYTVEGEVKYIGVCEKIETTLKDRLRRYQSMTGGSTNARIAGLIKECLLAGKEVKILALKPNTEIRFHGLRVDLVKGLENPLLQETDPEWNIRV